MGLKHVFILLLFLGLLSSRINAQNLVDSAAMTVSGDTIAAIANEATEVFIDTLENRPNTAALYSAALPGLGQAYNKQYWKIPILYGGGLVIGYFINYNHQLYQQYRDGLLAYIDGDDRTVPFDPRGTQDDYKRQVDYWRRNRDLLMIGAVVLYVAAIVDAHVDAHLELFTIDDDISLNLEPGFNTTAMNTNLYGISLKLRF